MKHVIWTSRPDYKDWKDDLESEYPELTEAERVDRMYDINSEYLEDERANLNINVGTPILIIADIGKWNGRFSGYSEVRSGNIADCLYSEYDPTWYVDGYGNLRCDSIHHDGTNHYLYRKWKPGVSEWKREELKSKIYDGKATDDDISRYTERLGDYIGDVYGWSFGKRKAAAV